MQDIEKEAERQADQQSQPVTPGSVQQDESLEDDPDTIFLNAVAEIDTQPLIKRKRKATISISIADVLQTIVCVGFIGIGCFGILWQAITYPHTLVLLFAAEKPASLTVMLAIPTRTLAPITIARSHTAPTTGTGHQDAEAANGILTFYNGNLSSQFVPSGTVFTGNDGQKVITDGAVTIPAGNPPSYGMASSASHTLRTGQVANIAPADIHVALSSDLLVTNLAPFTGGRDARTYHAVAPQDVQTLTSTVNETVTQAFTPAFPLQQGEQAIPTYCHTTTRTTHQIGEEAQSVTLTLSKTCSALAYNRQELDRQAAAAFTQTKPAASYHVSGSVQTTLQSVSPFTVTIRGKWTYIFSTDYEQLLAERIAGATPDQARKVLLHTGVIAYASIPNTLPPAMYITFVVLVGK